MSTFTGVIGALLAKLGAFQLGAGVDSSVLDVDLDAERFYPIRRANFAPVPRPSVFFPQARTLIQIQR